MSRVARLQNISLKVKDFVPPSLVLLNGETIFTNEDQVTVSWEEVADFEMVSNPVYYLVEFNNQEITTEVNQVVLNTTLLSDGEYSYRVKSCDQLENCSEWSESSLIIVDRLEPSSSVFFADSEVLSSVLNYSYDGDVLLNEEAVWQIANDSSNFWYENSLVVFSNKINSPFLYFEYQTKSSETLNGFDQTKLIVMINDKVIFIDNEIKENWQKIFIDLSEYLGQSVEVKILSGNQGDQLLSSSAFVRNISTEVFPLSIADQLSIISNEDIEVNKEINDHYFNFLITDQAGNEAKTTLLVSDGQVVNSEEKIDSLRLLGIVY